MGKQPILLCYVLPLIIPHFSFRRLLPPFYSWEEVHENASDFSFKSSIIVSQDHHPPAGRLAFPNPNAFEGQTATIELWLPNPGTPDTNQTFAQWGWSMQVF